MMVEMINLIFCLFYCNEKSLRNKEEMAFVRSLLIQLFLPEGDSHRLTEAGAARSCCLELKARERHTFKNSSRWRFRVFAKCRRLVFPSGIPNAHDLAGRGRRGSESLGRQVRSSWGDRLRGARSKLPTSHTSHLLPSGAARSPAS